jgi:hypothetical protein
VVDHDGVMVAGDRKGRDGVNPTTTHLRVMYGEMCRRLALSPRAPCGQYRSNKEKMPPKRVGTGFTPVRPDPANKEKMPPKRVGTGFTPVRPDPANKDKMPPKRVGTGFTPVRPDPANKEKMPPKRVGTGFTPVRPDPANTGGPSAPRTVY